MAKRQRNGKDRNGKRGTISKRELIEEREALYRRTLILRAEIQILKRIARRAIMGGLPIAGSIFDGESYGHESSRESDRDSQ